MADWTFRYRSETWVLPRQWLTSRYLPDFWRVLSSKDPSFRYGLCNSVSDTLDFVWQPFRSEAIGNVQDFHSLLGCYDLHRSDFEGHAYLFWSSGWGAPHKVHLYACQLIATYWRFADLAPERAAGGVSSAVEAACRGFDEFLRITISGGIGTRHSANRATAGVPDSCRMTVSIRNGQEYSRVHPPKCPIGWQWPAPSDEFGPEVRCGDGLRPNVHGTDWQMAEPIFNALGNCYTGNLTGSAACLGPNLLSREIGYGGVWNFTAPSAALYWRGSVCDSLLFWSRVCNDYALDRLFSHADGAGYLSFRTTALHLARYAMHHILHWAMYMVHEFGHTFRSDDLHCGGDAYCCFDVASKVFACRVRARLGIPAAEYSAAPGVNDFSNPISTTVGRPTCGSDAGVSQNLMVSCDTGVEGEPWHVGTFTAQNVTCVEPSAGPTPPSGVFTPPSDTSCLLLCSQISQTPEELARCRAGCLDREPDDSDVAGPQ